jgi:diguanylate cyclase (GGDEF)-like protein/PAS domain S-box-containing protein
MTRESRRSTEDAAQLQTFWALVTSTADAIFTKSVDGTILTWNRGAELLYGYGASDVIGRHVSLLDPDETGAEVRALLKAVAAGETVQDMETVRRRRDGTVVDVLLTISPIYGESGKVISASVIGRDITERRRLEGQLARHATHDDLTGLPNRALLEDRLARALARAIRLDLPLAVLFIDVDRVTVVNATHGYLVGDQLIAEVGTRLRAIVAGGDTVGRFGGDEFVVVCEETAAGDAEQLSNHIAQALAFPVDVSGVSMSTSASIGIAVSPPLIAATDALLRYAQAAMYEAKARGRARWHAFDSATEQRWNERLELGSELREAFTNERLELHYQPVVEIATGRLLGVEALLRWNHPKRGWVPPALFVQLAEESGLISQLDPWVLAHACLDAAGMRRDGVLPADAHLAVNVSAQNVSDTALFDWVSQAAADADFPLASLELEVTETGLMADARVAGQVLTSLRKLGVGVALDDFGTGYSSLTYLRRLPLSTIKVDHQFIQHITMRADDLAIVAAVVDLGRAVGLRTVAEGIETREQLAVLHRLGCVAGQGFLWSPAVPPTELAAVLHRTKGFLAASADDAGKAVTRRQPHPVTNEHGLHRIVQLHRDGASLATVAAALNAEQFSSPTGQRWHGASVARVIADIAYAAEHTTRATPRSR